MKDLTRTESQRGESRTEERGREESEAERVHADLRGPEAAEVDALVKRG